MDCYCDYDPATFYRSAIRKARKQCQCYECSRPIKPGETYEYVAGMWNGRFDTFRTCSHCLDIRQFVQNSVPCYCWAHGSIEEAAQYAIEEAYFRAPDEVRGLAFRAYRLLIARNRARQEGRT